MRKMIVHDPKKCTGCKTCEMVCSFTNSKEFSSLKTRIHNYSDLKKARFISFTCMQCEDAPCIKVCPSGALMAKNGILKIDSSTCIGCKLCLLSCPFGNILFDEKENSAVKCEQCERDPLCVVFCPTGALQYQMIDEVMEERRERVFKQLSLALDRI